MTNVIFCCGGKKTGRLKQPVFSLRCILRVSEAFCDLPVQCLFLAVSDLAVERRTLRMLLWFDIAAVFVTLLLLWTGQTKDIIIFLPSEKCNLYTICG